MPQHHTHKAHPAPSSPSYVTTFIDSHLAKAQEIQRRYGIPAGIVIAQSALETNWGRRVVGNAYFGVKGRAPDGSSATFTTHEIVGGASVQIQGTFRAYSGFDDAAEDYAQTVSGDPKYRTCYTQPSASKCAVALQHNGYATDKHYAAKLNAIIRAHKLDQYDAKASQ
ncbi:glucosaminidase domain-containing protein [Paraburkholderia agricolaris]|uniref:Glucosaminidase domain-containing protein n=1 Tax=Paraburkholderia agricolaris TaxID=2152888 RepID=A0ABW8ZGS1_9BURK